MAKSKLEKAEEKEKEALDAYVDKLTKGEDAEKEKHEYFARYEEATAAKYKEDAKEADSKLEKKVYLEMAKRISDLAREERWQARDVDIANEKAKTAARLASIAEMRSLKSEVKVAPARVKFATDEILNDLKEYKATEEKFKEHLSSISDKAKDFIDSIKTDSIIDTVEDGFKAAGEAIAKAVADGLEDARLEVKKELQSYNDVKEAAKAIGDVTSMKEAGKAFSSLADTLDKLSPNKDVNTSVWKEQVNGAIKYHNTTGEEVKLLSGITVLADGTAVKPDGTLVPQYVAGEDPFAKLKAKASEEEESTEKENGEETPIKVGASSIEAQKIISQAERIALNEDYTHRIAGILKKTMPALQTNRFVVWFTDQNGSLIHMYNGLVGASDYESDMYWYLPSIKKLSLAPAQPAIGQFNYGGESFDMALGTLKDVSTEAKMTVWSTQGLPFYKWVLKCLGKGENNYYMPGENIAVGSKVQNPEEQDFVDLHVCWIANNSFSTYLKNNDYSKVPTEVYSSICHITCKKIKFTGIDELKFENGMVGNTLSHEVKFTYEKASLTHETVKAKPVTAHVFSDEKA